MTEASHKFEALDLADMPQEATQPPGWAEELEFATMKGFAEPRQNMSATQISQIFEIFEGHGPKRAHW